MVRAATLLLLLQVAAAATARAGQDSAAEGAAEPERWQGAVGGGIQFRPRAGKPSAGGASGTGGPAAAAGGGAAVRLGVADAEGEEAGVGGAVEGEAGGDAEMQDAEGASAAAAAQQQQQQGAGGFKAPRARAGRGYRSKASAGPEGEQAD